MTVITETERSLYLATADTEVARVITDALPAIYDVSLYQDIKGLLNALKNRSAEAGSAWLLQSKSTDE